MFVVLQDQEKQTYNEVGHPKRNLFKTLLKNPQMIQEKNVNIHYHAAHTLQLMSLTRNNIVIVTKCLWRQSKYSCCARLPIVVIGCFWLGCKIVSGFENTFHSWDH